MNYDFDLNSYEYQQNFQLCDSSELSYLVDCVSNSRYDVSDVDTYSDDYQDF